MTEKKEKEEKEEKKEKNGGEEEGEERRRRRRRRYSYGRAHGPIEGSTRGPRGPKNLIDRND